MGLFGANMADFQLGLALDDKAGGYLETDEEIAQVRTAVLRRLPFIGMHRLRERRRGVVSFSILRPFGPFPVNTMLRAGLQGHLLLGACPARAAEILTKGALLLGAI